MPHAGMHALRLWLTTLAAGSLHLLGERAEGALHGMCCAGQPLESFRADCSTPSTGGNLALQRRDSRLQRSQLSPALRLECLSASKLKWSPQQTMPELVCTLLNKATEVTHRRFGHGGHIWDRMSQGRLTT